MLRRVHEGKIDLKDNFLNLDDTGDKELTFIISKRGSMDVCRNDGCLFYTPYVGYVIALLTKEFHDPLYYNDYESYIFGPKVSCLLLNQYLALKERFK